MSKLNWAEANEGEHAAMLKWVTDLIHLRRSSRCLNDGDPGHIKVSFSEEGRWLRMDRRKSTIVANLGPAPANFKVSEENRMLITSKPEFTLLNAGQLTVAPMSFVVISTEEPGTGN